MDKRTKKYKDMGRKYAHSNSVNHRHTALIDSSVLAHKWMVDHIHLDSDGSMWAVAKSLGQEISKIDAIKVEVRP